VQQSSDLYRQRCARCHGSDGSGSLARDTMPPIPDFSDHRWQSSRSDAGLLASILEGKGAQMPAFRVKVTEQEARSLVAHIRAFDPMPAARPPAGTRAGARDDFDERFHKLEEELREYQRQFRELSVPSRRP
jgi:mono/diheme cytochrome c family protein